MKVKFSGHTAVVNNVSPLIRDGTAFNISHIQHWYFFLINAAQPLKSKSAFLYHILKAAFPDFITLGVDGTLTHQTAYIIHRQSAPPPLFSFQLGTSNGHQEHTHHLLGSTLSPTPGWKRMHSKISLSCKKPWAFQLSCRAHHLHSLQHALASHILLAPFPAPAAVLVPHRISCPGWRNSSAWRNAISLLDTPRVSHWHKAPSSITANADVTECASTSQG